MSALFRRMYSRSPSEKCRLGLFTALLFLCIMACESSDPVAEVEPDPLSWMMDHAASIHVSPSVTDFSDLEAFRQSIGSSRVVLLGEQSHGDGTTFLAKRRGSSNSFTRRWALMSSPSRVASSTC